MEILLKRKFPANPQTHKSLPSCSTVANNQEERSLRITAQPPVQNVRRSLLPALTPTNEENSTTNSDKNTAKRKESLEAVRNILKSYIPLPLKNLMNKENERLKTKVLKLEELTKVSKECLEFQNANMDLKDEMNKMLTENESLNQKSYQKVRL